jgi:hypothetical protein
MLRELPKERLGMRDKIDGLRLLSHARDKGGGNKALACSRRRLEKYGIAAMVEEIGDGG